MYYFILILSLFDTIFWSYYFWKMIALKKFEKFSIVKLMVRYLIPAILLFSFGFTFIMYALDFKAVVTNQTKHYAGECEIILENLEEGEEPWLRAEFDISSITYDFKDYPSIEAGIYNCELEYYPGSGEGTEMELYRSAGGEAVKLN
ncbi:hypothetical protein B0H99_10391 [Planomicrobium soli]|uniref:Uncharacterized protein n=1 Tax=Planomicrobium soli TaxID=1176648 RepID=A0A2P8H428_9BACL|nr:hypothetical protein [Planomicrobium soli]PSL40959.1 hypothetical protein B0H99_10391 [Planomicrobium soli]